MVSTRLKFEEVDFLMLWMSRTLIVSSLTLAAGLSHAADATAVRTWPAPADEPVSEHYELRVDGQAVPVHACRVSAVPFNQVWPGYQRPLDQTELAGFACWDMQGPVKIEVQSRQAVQSVVVRPASRGIRPTIENNRIAFSLERPGPVIVEVNGMHHALHLFASLPEKDAPAPDARGSATSARAFTGRGRLNCTATNPSILPAARWFMAASMPRGQRTFGSPGAGSSTSVR